MKRPKKTPSLSPELAAFLAAPIRLPQTTAPIKELNEQCKQVADELLREAARQGILPRATLGVVYLSLEPESGDLALRSHLLWWGAENPAHRRALAGYAYAAHFNRKRESFFKRIPREKRSRSGWVGLFSSGMGKPLLLPEANSIHFDFVVRRPGDFGYLDSVVLDSSVVESRQTSTPPRVFDFGRLVAVNEIVFNTPPAVAEGAYEVVEYSGMGRLEGRGGDAGWLSKADFDAFVRDYSPSPQDSTHDNQGYFDHIFSGVQNSSYLLCTPELLSFDTQQTAGVTHPTGAETGFGFILDRNAEVEESTLRSCYWVSYKLATLLSPLRWLAEVKMKEELVREKDFFLEATAHVLLGPADMFQKWLDRAPPQVLSDKHVQRARASLGKTAYNAEALLQLADLRAHGKTVELAEMDVVQCVCDTFEHVVEAYSLLHPKLRTSFQASAPVQKAWCHAGLLRIAVTEAVRNACEEITLNANFGAGSKRADIELTIEPDPTGAGIVIVAVENAWAKPNAATTEELNKSNSFENDLQGRRKGSDHFGVGTGTLKRLVREFLGGKAEFPVRSGRFRCEIRLPTHPKQPTAYEGIRSNR